MCRFFDCLESHEQDRVEKILKYVDVKNRVRHLPGYLGWVDLDLGCSTILFG